MIDRVWFVLPALLMDRLLGEPARWHPLVGFGHAARWVEKRFYPPPASAVLQGRLHGLLAVLCLLCPAVGLTLWLTAEEGWLAGGVQLLLLYLALGGQSLEEHGMAVVQAMTGEGLAAARQRVACLVSRETRQMDEAAVARATVESLLENGCDALFAAVFWFLVLGGPGVVLYRLANTLDALWGYKNARYLDFGWAAARLDDLLNLIPARLTALTYLLAGHAPTAWRAWRGCRERKSPNATLVMAVGAGALGLQLGGAAIYHGQWVQNPLLGEGASPVMGDIDRAVRLLRRGVAIWACLALLWGGWLHA
ncbi:MAG: adenosylcobinamide-phosphate synthase CbiB [Magnetococcus sp. MYC-9]